MIKISMTSYSNKKGPSFLNVATRNYISARILFLNGQFFDGGVFAHEAIEKIMKALLYYKNPSGKFHNHLLNELKNEVEVKFSIDLSENEELFKYYEECYKYRYPDNPKPKCFGTGTLYIHDLDKVFIAFHDLVMEQINSNDEKYKSGIFSYCDDFFRDIDSNKIKLLVKNNDEIDFKCIEKAK